MPKRTHALVETPHHGDDDDKLDLEKGDVVEVLLKRDSDWWIGRLKEKRGLFPANNVKEIKGTCIYSQPIYGVISQITYIIIIIYLRNPFYKLYTVLNTAERNRMGYSKSQNYWRMANADETAIQYIDEVLACRL